MFVCFLEGLPRWLSGMEGCNRLWLLSLSPRVQVLFRACYKVASDLWLDGGYLRVLRFWTLGYIIGKLRVGAAIYAQSSLIYVSND